MDDDKIRVEVIYGHASTRPQWHATIDYGPPLKWWEIVYYGLLSFWSGVVVPAFLFALSFTCFLYAAKFAFS
jgi:hypothetical protein